LQKGKKIKPLIIKIEEAHTLIFLGIMYNQWKMPKTFESILSKVENQLSEMD